MDKCKCGGELLPVAFNCDIEDFELWDCFCSKCGEHRLGVEKLDKNKITSLSCLKSNFSDK